jgi:caffeoyl-CoA O-methyltransferase
VTPTTILAAELTDLCRELDGNDALDAGLRVRLRRARDLAAGLDPYLDECTTPESPALAELARRTHETDWRSGEFGASPAGLEQEMLSGHVEGQALKFLVHLSGARRVLEIGMFTGYSALAMAEALPDDGVVVACELDAAVARFAMNQFAASDAGRRITVEVGPAMNTLKRLVDEQAAPFDMVFIDADKPGYLAYFQFLLDSPLLAPGAVIAVDNTLLQGEPYGGGGVVSQNGAAIAAFNTAVADDSRVEQVLIPLRDGLTLIRRVDEGAPRNP